MKIGICGAHQAEKTALSVAVAATFPVSALSPQVQLLTDPQGGLEEYTYPVAKRLHLQRLRLNHLITSYQAPNFIADCTPVDLLGEVYLYITRNSKVNDAVLQLYRDTNSAVLLDLVFVLQANPKPQPPVSLTVAYQHHYNLLLKGLLSESSQPYVLIPVTLTSLTAQAEFICTYLRALPLTEDLSWKIL